MLTSKGDNNIDNSSKFRSTTSPALQTLFFFGRNRPLVSVCRHIKALFPEYFAFRDRLLEVFMATREQ